MATRDWVVTEDVSIVRGGSTKPVFALKRGMTVPEKYSRPTVIQGLKESLRKLGYGDGALMLKSEYMKLPGAQVPFKEGDGERLRIELAETQNANRELAIKNAALKAELKKLQRRE